MDKTAYFNMRKQVLLVGCELVNIDKAQAKDKRKLEQLQTKLRVSTSIDDDLFSALTDLLKKLIEE